MKLNKYIWTAVLPIAFTACQEEVMVEEYPLDSAVHTISCTIGEEQVEGRAQIVLGNKNRENEIFHWNAGDQFTLFETGYTITEENGKSTRTDYYASHTYTIDGSYNDNEPANTANFSCTGTAKSDMKSWVAFYPSTSVDESVDKTGDFCTLKIANSILDNGEKSWKDYFKDNMYMMDSDNVDMLPSGISFSHLCGIVRITYTNATETAHELKGIYVDGSLGNKQEYDLSNPALLSEWGTSNMHGLTFTDKATVAAGASEDFYILFFPPQATDGTELQNMKGIKVDYGVNGTSSMSQTPTQYFGNDFDYSGFMAGKCYWFRITGLDNGEIVWTKDYRPNDQGGQLINNATKLKEALANCSGDINYTIKVDGDIVLTEPLEITKPVVLDLCNHTISLSDTYNSYNKVAVITAKARLQIKNGHLKTNDGTTKLHQYYIENIENCDGVHLNNITLSTGSSGSVINAISGGPNPVALDESSITANGCAIHWGCNEEGMAFSTALRNSSITGDIIFITEKTQDLDRIYIESCEISGKLNATLPEGVNVTDIFTMDSDTEIADGKTGWDDLKMAAEEIKQF